MKPMIFDDDGEPRAVGKLSTLPDLCATCMVHDSSGMSRPPAFHTRSWVTVSPQRLWLGIGLLTRLPVK
jgi:hypothetical protein